MKLRDRLMRFMQGRYGMDAFSKFLSGAGFGCMLLALVFTVIGGALAYRHPVGETVFRVLYWVFWLLGIGLFGYSLFRMFSRNFTKRQAENTRYSYRMNKVTRKFDGLKERWRDRKTHRYIRCPKCRQQLRVPRNKGKIRVTCAKCGEKFIIKT